MTQTAISSLTQNMIVPGADLESYTRTIKQIPVLTAQEERELAILIRSQQDPDATRTLVMSHLRFVMYIANGYQGYGLPLADLIQEGNIGLMKAVRRFDTEVGVRLVSFAVYWIRSEIHEYILRNWRIVKVATTKAQRKLFFNLRSAKKQMGWFSQDEARRVAADLGVKERDVFEMERRLNAQDAPFENPNGEDDENTSYAPVSYLEDYTYNPEQLAEEDDWNKHTLWKIRESLDILDDRSRDILERRCLNEDKLTLQDLATEYGVSPERIRQIEKTAFKKVQKYLLENAPELMQAA
ncbi:MAG: RNA polymerase sigma factor RpoH [Pseudomonadota bacterium]